MYITVYQKAAYGHRPIMRLSERDASGLIEGLCAMKGITLDYDHLDPVGDKPESFDCGNGITLLRVHEIGDEE